MFFKNYEYFLTIVEEGSVTRAAEKLFISQPSLSKYLTRLEKNLDIALFDHSSSPLKLSPAGERYYTYVKRILTMDKQLSKEFEELKRTDSGKVSVGAGPWIASVILPDIMPALKNIYPHITLEAYDGTDEYLFNLIENDKLDIAIMYMPDRRKNIVCHTFASERILLVANIHHPILKTLNMAAPFDPDHLQNFDVRYLENEQFILQKPGQSLNFLGHEIFKSCEIHPEHIFDAPSCATALNLVSVGMGFSFLFESGSKVDFLPQNLTFFTVCNPEMTCPLAIVYKNFSNLTKYAHLVIDFIKDFYSPHHKRLGQKTP